MAKVTKIKAKESPSKKETDEPTITRKKVVIKDKKTDKAKRKDRKLAEKKATTEKSGKKPFILIRPFVYLGLYIRDSWRELRQVRWPNRKATWKMVIAVLVYTAIFVVFISLLDIFFTWLSNLILNK